MSNTDLAVYEVPESLANRFGAIVAEVYMSDLGVPMVRFCGDHSTEVRQLSDCQAILAWFESVGGEE